MRVPGRGEYDYELEGVDYIRFTGSVSTVDVDEEFEEPDRLPFGFRAPVARRAVVVAPVLSSSAWADWLS